MHSDVVKMPFWDETTKLEEWSVTRN